MSVYAAQVAAAAAAVEIRGPLRYAWLGRPSRLPPPWARRELDAAARRRHLVESLREELYWSFYCRGGVGPARWGEPTPVGAEPVLARAVAAAAGAGGRVPGWTVAGIDGDEAVVVSRGLRARVPLAACDAVGTPSVGALVTLPAPATPSAVSPGFLTLLRGGDSEDGAVVRVYWHVTCAGAVPLVRALTSRLGGAGVPFRLKVADHPLRFDRADAAVLYLPGAAFAAVRGDLAAVASELRPCLRPQPPVFTLPLAPGVGLAEQRADTAESFGQARCTLLAEGLVEARERRMRAGARLRVVAERFARAGVALEAPYREPALAGRHVL